MLLVSPSSQLLLESVPGWLKYGIIGLGALLCFLSFFLIYRELKTHKIRVGAITLITLFMLFSIAVLYVGFIAEQEKLEASAEPIDSKDEIAVRGRQKEFNLYQDHELVNYLESNVDNINVLYISGAHLQNGVGKIKKTISQILKNSGTVKVLITDPTDTMSIRLQAERKEPEHTISSITELINQTLGDLKHLDSLANGGKLQIKLIKRPLDERLHIINPNGHESRVYVKSYPFKNEHSNGVENGGLYFYIRNSNQENFTYQFYLDKYEKLFQHATK